MHMWNESVALIDNGKVYIDAWIEEGWDDENDCATDDYKYYGIWMQDKSLKSRLGHGRQ